MGLLGFMSFPHFAKFLVGHGCHLEGSIFQLVLNAMTLSTFLNDSLKS